MTKAAAALASAPASLTSTVLQHAATSTAIRKPLLISLITPLRSERRYSHELLTRTFFLFFKTDSKKRKKGRRRVESTAVDDGAVVQLRLSGKSTSECPPSALPVCRIFIRTFSSKNSALLRRIE
jgi:hypothetical protein